MRFFSCPVSRRGYKEQETLQENLSLSLSLLQWPFFNKSERRALAPLQPNCYTSLWAVRHPVAPETTENTACRHESCDDSSKHHRPSLLQTSEMVLEGSHEALEPGWLACFRMLWVWTYRTLLLLNSTFKIIFFKNTLENKLGSF